MGRNKSARNAHLPKGIDRPRPGGTYRARLTVDGRQYLVGYFETVTDARAALDIARGMKARGSFVPPAELRARRAQAARDDAADAYTLREWSRTWLDLLEARGRKPATIATYRSVLNSHVLPALGEVPLRSLTPADVDRFMASLRSLPAARYPGATVNGVSVNVGTCLRSCLNAAVRAGHLDVSPFRTPLPAPPRVRPGDPADDVATPEEVYALADAMPPRLALAVHLGAWCSLRLGEVLGLQRGDFADVDDAGRATLHVRRQLNSKTSPPSLTPPKSDAGRRSIAVPAFMLPKLAAHLDTFTGPGVGAPVFPSPRGGPLSQSAFDRHWTRARATVGRPSFRFHDLRHSGLTLYGQAGATVAELLARGGHRDVTVALHYQHASVERDRTLTARLSAALAPDVPTGAPVPEGVTPLPARPTTSPPREARA